MKNPILILTVLLLSTFAHADVSVRAKTKLTSACYYSGTSGDIEVTFKGDLPAGTRIELDYGFTLRNFSNGEAYDWAYKYLLPFEQENGSYVARVANQKIHARSASGRLEKFQFVLRFVSANGSVSVDNGGTSTWGYYEIVLPQPSNSCQLPNGDTFSEQAITRVEK
jgi:hypothetical protein